ncbi:MAG: hypothetical protein F4X65_11180 [Chloroflexi bacterium]|nr:hypothetical protein [Chloroflexota bacterium]
MTALPTLAHAIPPRTHHAQGQAAQRETSAGGWRKVQLPRGRAPGKPAKVERHGGKRSRSGGYAVSQRAGGNRVARESVRSAVVVGEQERAEPAG